MPIPRGIPPTSQNLYEQVRALFFLYAIYRFHVPAKAGLPSRGPIPFEGYNDLLHRRFEEAIQTLPRRPGRARPARRDLQRSRGGVPQPRLPDPGQSGARQCPLRARQPVDVPRGTSVRSSAAYRPRTSQKTDGRFPVLHERTPVRMDLSHSGWSDIFFLGMDYPEGARVLNISIDLALRKRRRATPRPPVEAYFRIIDTPVIRLVSTDLGAVTDVTSFGQLFDYAADYLGLLKGAVIASGIVPPSMEGANSPSRPSVPPGRARPRHRDCQPGEQHPEGVAPCRLDDTACLDHHRLHAATGQTATLRER